MLLTAASGFVPVAETNCVAGTASLVMETVEEALVAGALGMVLTEIEDMSVSLLPFPAVIEVFALCALPAVLSTDRPLFPSCLKTFSEVLMESRSPVLCLVVALANRVRSATLREFERISCPLFWAVLTKSSRLPKSISA